MKIRRFDIMIYLEMLLIFLILRQNGFLKYIIFLFWILYKALKNKRFHLNSLGYLLLPSLVCVILGGIISIFHKPNFETFREICFVIIPTFGAYVLGSIYDEKKIKKYIYASFQAIVTLFIIFGIGTFTVENLMESTYAFIFGIYVLYFLCCKNYKYMFLSIICMILADKRIVWGAVVVGSIVLVVLSKKKWERNNNLKRAQRIVGAVGMLSTVLMLLFVFMCRYGIIAKIMYSLNINSMGRLDVWNYFSKYYNFHIGYTGIGLGGVKQILNLLGNKHFDRLHNDILLYYIELGFGGFFIFIFSHFQMINHFIRERIITYKNAMDIIVLIVYTLVCYCTDNISIYIHYIFPLYLIMCDFLKKERKPGEAKDEIFNNNNFI